MLSQKPNEAADRGSAPQTCPDLEDLIHTASAFINDLEKRPQPPTWDEQVKFCFITRDSDALLREAWKREEMYPQDSLLAYKTALTRAIAFFGKHPTTGALHRRLDGKERASTTNEIIDSLIGRVSLIEAIL